jgi:hypothetical protein
MALRRVRDGFGRIQQTVLIAIILSVITVGACAKRDRDPNGPLTPAALMRRQAPPSSSGRTILDGRA